MPHPTWKLPEGNSKDADLLLTQVAVIKLHILVKQPRMVYTWCQLSYLQSLKNSPGEQKNQK